MVREGPGTIALGSDKETNPPKIGSTMLNLLPMRDSVESTLALPDPQSNQLVD
ncbi:hypothetical protein FHX81_2779 [Saccharothrix saharensis]|uniref:Uncharacterized protein n=1 Tax=Saccharothrix saharensis TaxID=571190 RepID=A0A543JC66_9PSEU|nr:hypothetical protein FHX81_2779 [Saccharothrix saharensis]